MDEIDANVQIETVSSLKEVPLVQVIVDRRVTVPLVLERDALTELKDAFDRMNDAYHHLDDAQTPVEALLRKKAYFDSIHEYKKVNKKHLLPHQIYNFKTGTII
jgi:hypothetical protein